MKTRQHAIAAAGLVASLILGSVAAAVPAQAMPAPDHSPIAAPTTAVASNTAVAADPPATEPGATYRYYSGSKTVSCERGYACASAPYWLGYYIFKFYDYGTYKLYRWLGTGSLANNQTGGASVRLLDVNKRRLKCRQAGTGWGDVNWDPVYYIQVSRYAC